MKCHLCLQKKKLIKAHIIPESFFLPLRDGKKAPKILSNIEGEHPRRSLIGIYDTSILCSGCDNVISDWDNYAQDLLLKKFSENLSVYNGTRKVAYKIDKFDYKKLKLFFISVLWRASISRQSFFKRIKLGPYESLARKMILEKNPGSSEDFAVIVAKFSDPIVTAILDPHMDKFDGVNFCRIYMTGFVIYVKVDKRKTPEFLKNYKIRENGPIYIILRDLHKSRDGKIIKDITTKNPK